MESKECALVRIRRQGTTVFVAVNPDHTPLLVQATNTTLKAEQAIIVPQDDELQLDTPTGLRLVLKEGETICLRALPDRDIVMIIVPQDDELTLEVASVAHGQAAPDLIPLT